MERILHRNSRAIVFLKVLLVACIVTGLLLTLLSFIMFKSNVSNGILLGGIIVIYILSSFIGGFLFGKGATKRRFVWGMGFGLIYGILILMFSLVSNPLAEVDFMRGLVSILVCSVSGMIGAILS